MDKITVDRIQLTHPKERGNQLKMYTEMCEALKGRAMLRFAYTLRTFAEQDGLYALGRTLKNPDGYNATKKPLGNIVTWAKGGSSYHNYGLAFDIVLIIDKDGDGKYETASWDMATDFDGDGISDWREVVDIAMKYGYECGCHWNKPKTDNPHFQRTFGYSVAELKALFDAKKFIGTSNYVLI